MVFAQIEVELYLVLLKKMLVENLTTVGVE